MIKKEIIGDRVSDGLIKAVNQSTGHDSIDRQIALQQILILAEIAGHLEQIADYPYLNDDSETTSDDRFNDNQFQNIRKIVDDLAV